MNTTKDTKSRTENNIPISLGKPSLRRRLEAYYSLVNPASIEDPAKWRTTFDQIYEKYGGTYAGERTLANKLGKKYGSTQVRLLLAESSAAAATKDPQSTSSPIQQREESWFELRPEEGRSQVIDMTSHKFDPLAALQLPSNQVVQTNPWVPHCPVLNGVDQFRSRLPTSDPFFRVANKKNAAKIMAIINQDDKTPKSKQRHNNPFAAIADQLQSDIWKLLHSMWEKRQRCRVMIRYVNGVRGTLTGYLLAYDKHYNMILRDVEEVYSPRVPSSLERVDGENEPQKPNWSVRKRHMKQILVRGDNVVLVYKADRQEPPKRQRKTHTF